MKLFDKKIDYLIIGSGLYGATFAYKARKADKSCLVIDKRPHFGGNVYCEKVEGINVHKFGAHFFHTSNKEVWDFVNSIVEFNRYTNSPIANYKGELYNLPFNMNTFNKMWPEVKTPKEARLKIDSQIKETVEEINKQHAAKGLPPIAPSPEGRGWEGASNLEEQALLLVGRDIYEKLIKDYTEKQWGRDCKDLPAFIIRRLPVRLVFDNNYFNDKYQGIPIGGYNKLIDGLLEGVDTLINIDFFTATLGDITKEKSSLSLRDNWQEIANKLVYTGQLDQYFNCRLGKLDWRTVSFKTRIEDTPNYQGNAVVNYTSHDVPYTRVIEHKHFEMFGPEMYNCPKTVVSEEYSTEYKEGMEPYYPVNNERNNNLADLYRQLTAKEPNVLFGGRLAEYKYYDMAPIIEKVLNLWK